MDSSLHITDAQKLQYQEDGYFTAFPKTSIVNAKTMNSRCAYHGDRESDNGSHRNAAAAAADRHAGRLRPSEKPGRQHTIRDRDLVLPGSDHPLGQRRSCPTTF